MMEKMYTYHKPSEEGIEKIAKLRKAFSDLHDVVKATCPVTREQAVALTNLEQSAMWAIKSVVYNDPKSVVEI